MKLFCSVAMTGENTTDVIQRTQQVATVLQEVGYEVYAQPLDSSLDGVAPGDVKTFLRYAFEKLNECDGLVVIVTSPQKSEGQLMEVGVALAESKPIYLFLHVSAQHVSSHLPKVATKTFLWRTEEELSQALRQLAK